MKRFALAALLVAQTGCASLGALGVQAPRIESASGRPGEISLVGPSSRAPMGGVRLRLWARVTNPNPLGLTLTQLAGTLALEGMRAADVRLPLGLPLAAAADTVVPIDLEVGFADVPALANLVPNALTRGAVAYDLNGTIAVDAGPLGQPSFGPMTLLEGSVRTTR